MYIIRLDDASEHMDIDNWMRMKDLLDKYHIKPIYGIIPNNQDPELLRYGKVPDFWELMRFWQTEGWIPALHGYNHVFETEDGGMNPVNKKSEFAGLSLERQREKLRAAYEKLKAEGIKADIFFAPAHTFDVNTLKALCRETQIKVISDTIAWDVYYKKPFYFIPQQSGRVRKLPFKIVTFCCHPNTMRDEEYKELELFISKYKDKFGCYKNMKFSEKNRNILDKLLAGIYFMGRK